MSTPFPGSGDVAKRLLTLESLRARAADLVSDFDAAIAEERRRHLCSGWCGQLATECTCLLDDVAVACG